MEVGEINHTIHGAQWYEARRRTQRIYFCRIYVHPQYTAQSATRYQTIQQILEFIILRGWRVTNLRWSTARTGTARYMSQIPTRRLYCLELRKPIERWVQRSDIPKDYLLQLSLQYWSATPLNVRSSPQISAREWCSSVTIFLGFFGKQQNPTSGGSDQNAFPCSVLATADP